MDNQLENLLAFFREVDDLSQEPLVDLPRFAKVYLRHVINPFEFFSDDEFKLRYRFSKTTVVNIILPEIVELNTFNQRGLPIAPDQQLLVALRFYATGNFQKVCSDLVYISQPTVCHIVERVSRVLAGKLTKFVHFPRGPNLAITKHKFRHLGASRNLPGLSEIVGAVDCTHVKINRPRGILHSEDYRNRHGWFSINAQVVAGPGMEIYDVVSRWPGSSHDSRIFRNSRVHARLTNGDIDGILVGDGGYACTGITLTPLRNPSTPSEENYNKVQIRTRNVVERTFGVLKRRFPCLQKGLGYKLTTSCNIILACCILHNIALKYESPNDHLSFETIADLQQPQLPLARRHSAEGLALRAEIIRNLF